ncbi:MAG: PBP1A family penicillin-binding protein [Acidobacteriia bacterium]|nr:PBP1A family penicillin-binding protein [Terriglobia bacterium]
MPSPAPANRNASRSIRKRGGSRLSAIAAWKKALLALALLLVITSSGIFVYYYVRFSRLIDARLSGDIFNHASLVFAAPTPVYVGEAMTPEEAAARLRLALYAQGQSGSQVGTYTLSGERLEVHPGPLSYFQSDLAHEGGAVLEFRDGRIASISTLESGGGLQRYELEPQVITTLFDSSRSKRRLVHYQNLPKPLVDAVLAAEDHRFFSHHGVNFYRILVAALKDVRAEEKLQGGSTLTMQLARNFFLTPRRTFKRKVAEIFLAMLMEQRLSKEQIFELYSNQIYLGQRGSFSVYGFGEAASSYFNKDVSSLTLPEAALLAGLIRGPNLYSPYKYPSRALDRRNYVLRQMLSQGMITSSEAEQASAAPLGVVGQNTEGLQAPYFVDMVKDQLLAQFSEHDLVSQSYRVYTTLDLDLQKAAMQGVHIGMGEVDQQVKKMRRPRGEPPAGPNQPQVALISLDPHSGEVRALVGGRDYGASQLNHILAKRQPGSSFKPFVYAAALNSGVDGSQPLITPATILDDEPTTFQWGDQTYQPENYKQEYRGMVTVREAITHSLNVATVHLAEMIGYDKVRALAIAAGINKDILATPAIALGAYIATPLEIAGAYTIFANGGQYIEPKLLVGVNDASGHTLWRSPTVTRPVLDPRVAFLMVSLMESVINNGTGAGARSRGFTAPAAGKTGTSHDGWFAGFTSNLLTVAWVGYDDDRELKLAGASSALPVWTEFMKRAVELTAYHDVQDFVPPPGIVSAPIIQNASATSGDASETQTEYFIDGTQPTSSGPIQTVKGILSRLFHPGGNNAAPASPPPMLPSAAAAPPITNLPPQPGAQSNPPSAPKKGGVLRKFLSIFKGKSNKPESPPEAPKNPQPQN